MHVRTWSTALLALTIAACGKSSDTLPASASATSGAGGAGASSATSSLASSDASSAEASNAASSGTGGSGSTTSSGAGGMDAGKPSWRSALYPKDWTPSFTDAAGRFLHDFSYAGYHLAADEPGANLPGSSFDVVAQFGADASGANDATAAIQAAIDAASAQGGIVSFPAGFYRVDGKLTLTSSNVVLHGMGPSQSQIHFTKIDTANDKSLDYSAHLSIHGTPTSNLEIPLAQDGENRSNVVRVADAGALAPGDDIAVGWVITPEFIADHGMTGTWVAFNGTWQPFFWRTVVSIDKNKSPQEITVDVPLRYPAKTRDTASVRRFTGLLSEVGIEGLGVSNGASWDAAWLGAQIHAIEFIGVKDAWVRDVESFVSPAAPANGPGAGGHLQSSGILVEQSKRVTIANVKLAHAQNIGSGGNGYLFELRQDSEVLVRDSSGTAGRHNFIQNWGFGTTGCVFLRIESSEGKAQDKKDSFIVLTAYSETHHSLATANLFDSSTFKDGVSIVNRGSESTGAGQTGTQNVLWNLKGAGTGVLRSLQFDMGYVIGAHAFPTMLTSSLFPILGSGTAPDDWVEGTDNPLDLDPPSLYEDQRLRRIGH